MRLGRVTLASDLLLAELALSSVGFNYDFFVLPLLLRIPELLIHYKTVFPTCGALPLAGPRFGSSWRLLIASREETRTQRQQEPAPFSDRFPNLRIFSYPLSSSPSTEVAIPLFSSFLVSLLFPSFLESQLVARPLLPPCFRLSL